MSLAGLLKGETELNRKALFWQYPHYGNQGGFPGSAVRSGDWKLIVRAENDKAELYNLRLDPSEKKDLSSTESARVEKLRSMLKARQKGVNAISPTPNP